VSLQKAEDKQVMTRSPLSAAAVRFSQLLLAAAFALTAQGAAIFTFDADPVGTTTQFTDTVNGISATFSSPADPGGFQIQPSIFQALTGNVLGDPGPNFANNIPLTITFNQDLVAIDTVFATADFGAPSPFTLTAFLGTHQVGTVTSSGVVPPGFTFPEGEIAFHDSAFNTVVLSSSAPDFAIDHVAVASAPEPGVSGLIGLGLFAIGVIRPRRKR
jgi:hypothetical protein